MRIVMVSPHPPAPRTSGGRVRLYNLIKELSKENEVSLWCLRKSSDDMAALSEIARYCADVHVFERNPIFSVKNVAGYIMSQSSIFPLAHRHAELAAGLRERLSSNGDYDIVHAEAWYVLTNLPADCGVPVVLDEPSIDYVAMERYLRVLNGFGARIPWAVELLRLRRAERQAWARVDACAAVSEPDLALVRAAVSDKPLTVVPNGVACSDFRFLGREKRDVSEVLYVGNFCHYSNVDGARFLCTEVLPKLKKRVGNVRITIVGSDPPSAVQQLGASPDVRVAGTVPDVRLYLARAAVLVCPLRAGSGTRIRILEAMAAGIPIVSTTIGCEGLHVRPGKHALVADGSDAIAEAVLQLLVDSTLARSLAEQARRLVERRYRWADSARSLQHLYERASSRQQSGNR